MPLFSIKGLLLSLKNLCSFLNWIQFIWFSRCFWEITLCLKFYFFNFNQLVFVIIIKKYSILYGRQRDTQNKHFRALTHSPNAHSSQSWAGMKPGTPPKPPLESVTYSLPECISKKLNVKLGGWGLHQHSSVGYSLPKRQFILQHHNTYLITEFFIITEYRVKNQLLSWESNMETS